MDTPTELAKAAGISVPYASQLLSGKRKPSESFALAIYRKTGKKFGPLESLSDEQIAFLVSIRKDAA